MQLQRNDMIMSMSDIVTNLVKKYNNFTDDDDLYQIGMLAVINGVDSCIAKEIEDKEIIKAVCIVRARNAIIDEQRHSSYLMGYTSEDYEIEELINDADSYTDVIELEYDLRNNLSEMTYSIYNMLLSGYNVNEICDMLGMSKTYVYNHITKLKEFLKSYKE